MRELTEKEDRLARDILADRKPLYIGDKSFVKFIKVGDRKLFWGTSNPPEGKAERINENTYEIEFEACVSNHGCLIWIPVREI